MEEQGAGITAGFADQDYEDVGGQLFSVGELTAKDQSRASDLLDIQREILKPVVQSHDGQWVKEMGDGLILTFSTITKACL